MKTRYLTVLTALVAVSGCVQPTSLSNQQPAGRVLAEIEYVNYAWGKQYYGYFVTGNGEVYKYDRKGEAWEPPAGDAVSEADLLNKYLQKSFVDDRPAAEAASLQAKISNVPAGPLSPEKFVCADAGTLTYWVYRFEQSTGRYVRVLLRREGDVAQQNTSAQAQDLIAYIRSLKLAQEMNGCDP